MRAIVDDQEHPRVNDDLIRQIRDSQFRTTGRALKNTLDPIAEPREATSVQSSEVVQEQVGFLGRLRGRRR